MALGLLCLRAREPTGDFKPLLRVDPGPAGGRRPAPPLAPDVRRAPGRRTLTRRAAHAPLAPGEGAAEAALGTGAHRRRRGRLRGCIAERVEAYWFGFSDHPVRWKAAGGECEVCTGIRLGSSGSGGPMSVQLRICFQLYMEETGFSRIWTCLTWLAYPTDKQRTDTDPEETLELY